MTGGEAGRETTSRSPYLLSVENIGASVLTSHLNLVTTYTRLFLMVTYLPLVAMLVLTRRILLLLLCA